MSNSYPHINGVDTETTEFSVGQRAFTQWIFGVLNRKVIVAFFAEAPIAWKYYQNYYTFWQESLPISSIT